MPAHLRSIERPKCRRCDSYATKVLHNSANSPIGEYCTRHALAALSEFQAVSGG